MFCVIWCHTVKIIISHETKFCCGLAWSYSFSSSTQGAIGAAGAPGFPGGPGPKVCVMSFPSLLPKWDLFIITKKPWKDSVVYSSQGNKTLK